jgi:hypothetical protein
MEDYDKDILVFQKEKLMQPFIDPVGLGRGRKRNGQVRAMKARIRTFRNRSVGSGARIPVR